MQEPGPAAAASGSGTHVELPGGARGRRQVRTASPAECAPGSRGAGGALPTRPYSAGHWLGLKGPGRHLDCSQVTASALSARASPSEDRGSGIPPRRGPGALQCRVSSALLSRSGFAPSVPGLAAPDPGPARRPRSGTGARCARGDAAPAMLTR